VARDHDWETGEGLLGVDDPGEIDAAFDRGERHVGTALIGFVLNGEDFAVVAPRVERGLRSTDRDVRQYAFTAAGHTARLFGELSPGIYDVLRAEGPHGVAENAITDALDYVPFRDLPGWLKRLKLITGTKRFLARRWIYAVEDVRSGISFLGSLTSRLLQRLRKSGG
jgi:hypothetical protein